MASAPNLNGRQARQTHLAPVIVHSLFREHVALSADGTRKAGEGKLW
jgi:hypothetical protein